MSQEPAEDCSELRKISAIILRSPDSSSDQIGPIGQQAANDDQLIDLWLHGRPANTRRAYRREIVRFTEFVDKPLQLIKLFDIQSFSDHLPTILKQSSVHRALSAVKSLFRFGYELGYLNFDVGKPLKIQGFRDQLADRILDETEVLRIIALEQHPRNRAMLILFYSTGLRVSEICSVKWKHLQERNSSGQITVFGKGDKTRTILLPEGAWKALIPLKATNSSESPMFRSRKKGHLDESAVWRVVKKAAKRAGIEKDVSCHWFRHAHASHALDRNCPIHLVQATLGHSSISTTGRYLHARPSDSSGNYLPF